MGEAAKASGIVLSLHAPYFINLANPDPESLKKTTGYILSACQAADWMGATRVTVHTGALMKRTRREALDIALILHMEHGGGNNSTFTTRVVTSSGSDTYSTMAAALSSLKGPRHGGANIKVIEMIQDIKGHLSDWTDPEETSHYLRKILNKETFDHSGLIYGMGHAVYSISDPREQILRSFVNQLALEKGRQDDLALYRNIEVEAPKLISNNRPIFKGVSPNIDLYSGFLYDLLGIPMELYTPLFAIARIVGWSAHRIEELVCMNKIIRPAYMSVMRERG